MHGVKYPCPMCAFSVENPLIHLSKKHRVLPTLLICNYLRTVNISVEPLHRCHVENCTYSLCRSLGKHLELVHGMTPGTREYQEEMSKSNH